MNIAERARQAIRSIPDFPVEGVTFRDITPVLEDPSLCRDIIDHLAGQPAMTDVNAVIGVESRGFLFGLPLAMQLDIPFITVRKKGKLPYETISHCYDLEYGSAEIEMHTDAMQEGWKVLIHDDLLATGGTAAAAAELVRKQGGTVGGFAFLVELSFLEGREKLAGYSGNIVNLVKY